MSAAPLTFQSDGDFLRLVHSTRDIAIYKESLRRDPCAYCGGKSEVLDHLTPKASGGLDGSVNLVGACWFCNSSKGGRSLLSYLAFLFRRAFWESIAAERTAWNGVGR